MTFIMLLLAHGARTPYLLWIIAMLCDTIMITVYMILKASGKL